MPDVELLRQAIAMCMLLVASYFDIKGRKVSDMVWTIPGGAGAILYLLEPVTPAAILYTGIGTATAAALFFSRAFGQADCLALVALAVILPLHDGLPTALAAAIAMPLFASSYTLCRNVSYNISDMLRGRLFSGIRDSPHRKAAAFFLLHKKRRHERFAVIAQSGDRLAFCFKPVTCIEIAKDFEGYVMSALPMMPFMAVALAMIIAL